MPAITNVEFRQFSAQHRNASRNWLIVKLNTDDPNLYGLDDAGPMEDEEEIAKYPPLKKVTARGGSKRGI